MVRSRRTTSYQSTPILKSSRNSGEKEAVSHDKRRTRTNFGGSARPSADVRLFERSSHRDQTSGRLSRHCLAANEGHTKPWGKPWSAVTVLISVKRLRKTRRTVSSLTKRRKGNQVDPSWAFAIVPLLCLHTMDEHHDLERRFRSDRRPSTSPDVGLPLPIFFVPRVTTRIQEFSTVVGRVPLVEQRSPLNQSILNVTA